MFLLQNMTAEAKQDFLMKSQDKYQHNSKTAKEKFRAGFKKGMIKVRYIFLTFSMVP